MKGVSNSAAIQKLSSSLLANNVKDPSSKKLEAREAFQDFVSGTFYKQMLKALRETQSKPAYFHGGSAEEMFQSQMDQQVAEDLAKDHGSEFSDPLFAAFSRQQHALVAGSASSSNPVTTHSP